MITTIPVNINLDIHREQPGDLVNIGSPYVTRDSISTLGDTNEIKRYLVSAGKTVGVKDRFSPPPIYTNRWNHIARGKIKLDSLYYLSRLPHLVVDAKFKQNFKLNIKRKVRPEEYYDTVNKRKLKKYVIECSYEILYKNTNRIYKSNPISCSIRYQSSLFPSQVLEKPVVRDIQFGSLEINKDGEEREITIYGNPGAVFGLAINETFDQQSADTGYGDSGALSFTNKINDKSLINKSSTGRGIFRSEYRGGIYGDGMIILRGILGANGRTSFKQQFPSNTIKRVVVGIAVSNSLYVGGINTAGIKIGDRIYAEQIASGTVVKVVEIHPDEDSSGSGDDHKIKLDTQVTITQFKSAYFKRDRSYSIDIIPEYTSGTIMQTKLESGKITGEGKSYSLKQQGDVVITWRILGNGGWTITTNNGVDPSVSRGDPYDIAVSVKPGSRNTIKTSYNLLLDLHSGGHRFRAIRKPVLSQHFSGARNDFGTSALNYVESMLRNTFGTKISITNFNSSLAPGSDSHTINVLFDLNITYTGNKSVTIPFDINKILTYS